MTWLLFFCKFIGLTFHFLTIFLSTNKENPILLATLQRNTKKNILFFSHWGEKANLHSPQLSSPPKPEFLPFHIDAESTAMIEAAKKETEATINDSETCGFYFKGYGKKFIKANKLGPDSFVQNALQLAFYRMHRVPGAGYETGSLRRFKWGRTDIIRCCSPESIEFARSMLADKFNVEKRLEAMRLAVQEHGKFSKMVMAGQGFDRHFLGLIRTAKENGEELPALFLDPAFKRSGRYRISTSQVSCLIQIPLPKVQ